MHVQCERFLYNAYPKSKTEDLERQRISESNQEEAEKRVQRRKIINIWGLFRYTQEQKEWLLNPETIRFFRENELTRDERIAAFQKRRGCP